MTDQPRDEGAVDRKIEGFGASFNRDDDAWHIYTMPDCEKFCRVDGYGPEEVEAVLAILRASLEDRAQLTAATRRADDLATALKATAQAAASSATKVEQAERMLAEAKGLLEDAGTLSVRIEYSTPWHERRRAWLTTIRSAASGEQG